MRALVLILASALALAGCLAPSADEEAPPAHLPGAADGATLPEPIVTEWEGWVLDSRIEGPSHVQPTEQVVEPVVRQGFMYDVKELPQLLQVRLDWEGPDSAQFMIMLHSHKEHGTNVYAEHVTEMSSEKSVCLEVPPEDFTTGEWQVMVHSRGARDATFTLRVVQAGGAGGLVEGAYHGHWLQDGAFEVEEREILPCVELAL